MLKYLPVVMMLGFLGGCAKEKAYDDQYKGNSDEVESLVRVKKQVTEMCSSASDPCLYVPSVANTPYAVTASRPFWQGEAKLVIAKWNVDKLQFLQIENDQRFGDNVNNLSPVFDISVSHHDYKCSEDEYGDCTNKEVEDDEKVYKDKRFYKVNDISVVETNSLPIEFGEFFNSGCFSQTASEITKYQQENDALNITVKKTYKTSSHCADFVQEMDDLRYLNFSIDYNYSIVKLSTLTDKAYKAVDYPVQDETHFGFFKTEIKKKTVDNHDHYMGLKDTYLNRWSPNKKVVNYHLNSEFYKPENQAVLDATFSAIASVNSALAKANANLQVKLVPGKDDEIGDLRKNYIIFVKDPQASGVIGYGPTVSDPNTGEILNGRTVMYFGTIQKFVSRAYDELVDEVIAGQNKGSVNTSQTTQSTSSEAAAQNSLNTFALTNEYSSFVANLFNMESLGLALSQVENDSVLQQRNLPAGDFSKMEEQTYFELRKNLSNENNSFEQKMAALAKETFYHGNHVDFDGAVISALKADLLAGQELKHWDELTEPERAKMMDKLVPYVWVPTLVHEFGHNLGLRHNFYGSVDKENYYNTEERQELNLSRDVTYSSIMDYSARTNNELMVMGKYDVAALKFAYAREVEAEGGESIKIKTTIKDLLKEKTVPLKEFMYCSDEHVNTNVLCNRFDDGSSYEEVAAHYIEQYKKNYEKVNFRRRKYSYESRNGDFNYLVYIFNSFANIRQFFNLYDQEMFNGSYEEEKWKSHSEERKSKLLDIKKASDMSFQFFKEIIEAPAYHCIEFDKNTGTGLVVKPFTEMAKGTKLEEFGITFDIKYGCLLLNNYGREGKGYAEFGKYFNNSLDLLYDRSQIHQGDTSQIDVRGSWMDKVIASLFASARMTSPTTIGASSSGNYFDYPTYREELESTIDGLLSNTLTRPVDVTLPSGSIQKLEMTYSVEGSHEVNKSYNGFINYYFGLKNSRTNLKSIMVKFLKRELQSTAEEGNVNDGVELADYQKFDVDRVPVRTDLSQYNYDEIVEFKNEKGQINYRFGFYSYNTKAAWLAKMKLDYDLLKEAKAKTLETAKLMKISDKYSRQFNLKPILTKKTVMAAGELSDHARIEYLKDISEGSLSEDQMKFLNDLFEIKESSDIHYALFAEVLKVGTLTKEDVEEANYAKDLSDEFLEGMISGSLDSQVLLSSFMALSK